MLEYLSAGQRILRFTVILLFLTSGGVSADGGISLQGTRIVYPQDSRQQSLSIHNTSATDSYLVQSWVEDANGRKSHDIVVTPPLYLSSPGNENILRFMRVAGQLPLDRETLYYFTAKAIPSIDEREAKGTGIVHFAAASRIKLFVRPDGLALPVAHAPEAISFKAVSGKLEINNPTPYYITFNEIYIAGRLVNGMMIAPKSSTLINQAVHPGISIKFNTINDFGVVTEAIMKVVY